METYTFQSLGDGEYIINTKVDGRIVSFYTIDDGFGCSIEVINDHFIIVNMKDEETGEVTRIPLSSEESTEANNNLLELALQASIEDEETDDVTRILLSSEELAEANNNLLQLALQTPIKDEECY